ncbi:MAG: UDP-galactose-4-epimerase [Nitrospirales bacterium]|nr:MAG: UDP-galactose-4-epimerase [Nitrospirales bacterium]
MRNHPKVLVTGANGFLGQEIVTLFQKDYHVIASSRHGSSFLTSAVDYVSADLVKDQISDIFPDNIDVLVHAAGVMPGSAFNVTQNVTMTQRIIDWAIKAEIRSIVLVSSASVYAPFDGAQQESFECKPESEYGKSKLDSEKYALDATANLKVNLIILRMPALIGPTRQGNVGRLIQALATNRFLLIGDGANRKSLLHVKDAALACLRVVGNLENDYSSKVRKVFNVSAMSPTMADIIDFTCKELNKDKPPSIPAGWVIFTLKVLCKVTFGARLFSRPLQLVKQFQQNDVLDATLFQKEVGIELNYDVRQGLREMVFCNK